MIRLITSVTRWLDYFSIFGHLSEQTFVQCHKKFTKVVQIFHQLINKTPKFAQDLKDFAKSGHTAETCSSMTHREMGIETDGSKKIAKSKEHL